MNSDANTGRVIGPSGRAERLHDEFAIEGAEGGLDLIQPGCVSFEYSFPAGSAIPSSIEPRPINISVIGPGRGVCRSTP